MLVNVEPIGENSPETYQTQEKSPCGMYLIRLIDALAAATQSAADENTLGFKGLALSPLVAKFESRLVQYP